MMKLGKMVVCFGSFSVERGNLKELKFWPTTSGISGLEYRWSDLQLVSLHLHSTYTSSMYLNMVYFTLSLPLTLISSLFSRNSLDETVQFELLLSNHTGSVRLWSIYKIFIK